MILALWPPALQYQLPALFFVCVLFVLFLLFVVVLSGSKGEGMVDRKLVQAPSIFIAGVPRQLFCFGSLVFFRCGVPLFIVIHANINIKIG